MLCVFLKNVKSSSSQEKLQVCRRIALNAFSTNVLFIAKLFESFYLQKYIANSCGSVLLLLKLQVSNLQINQDKLNLIQRHI